MTSDAFASAFPSKTPTSTWVPDILGPDFEQSILPLGPDHREEGSEGDIFATLVRYTAGLEHPTAVLWVHGMSDYFFQAHVARRLNEEGYATYGIDLRKCGRSHRDGQRWHHVTDMELYFEELTQALELIVTNHERVIPLGHSTGGLIVSLWLDYLRRERPDLHSHIPAVVFNSPWLDLMFPAPAVATMVPVINALGRVIPNLALPAGTNDNYGSSIHASRAGRFDFDTTMKPLNGHNKALSWMRAVIVGQQKIWNNQINVGVPVLTLCSARSYLGHKEFNRYTMTSDTILDVEQISRRSAQLGDQITLVHIPGAVHDVFLSEPAAEQAAFDAVLSWLEGTLTR